MATTYFSYKDDTVPNFIHTIPLALRRKKARKICTICNFEFACICRLEQHFIEEHNRYPILTSVCPLCGKLYKNSCEMLMHIKNYHPNNSAMAKIALEERSHVHENYNVNEVKSRKNLFFKHVNKEIGGLYLVF